MHGLTVQNAFTESTLCVHRLWQVYTECGVSLSNASGGQSSYRVGVAFSRLSKDRHVEAEQNQRWFLPGFSASGKGCFKIAEVELIYSAVLASGAQQRNSVI